MKICITGGTGFIGRKLVDALATEGHQLSILSRRNNISISPSITFVAGDLADGDCSLDRFVSGCNLIFHCAGETSDIRHMHRVHVDGTRLLLDAVRRYVSTTNKRVHWVQLSSVGAYGLRSANRPDIDIIVTEAAVENPIGEYEITKTRADGLVRDAARDGFITFTMLRPTFVFGAGMRNQSLISLARFIRRGLFFYIGKKGAVANYVHVDDVVDALRLCGFDRRAIGQTYNLSNDCVLEEVVESIAAQAGIPKPKLRVPRELAIVLVKTVGRFMHLPLTLERIAELTRRHKYPSDKICSQLGFQPKRYVPDAIKEL